MPDGFIVTAIKSFVLVNLVMVMFAFMTWFERRLIGRFQVRLGPNRVGPFGLLQPIADLGKLIQMVVEDDVPLPQALQDLDDQVKARQAAAAQAQASPADLQPGLAPPGAPGTAQALAPIQGPNPSQQNMLRLLGSLRLPQRQSPAEIASPTG